MAKFAKGGIVSLDKFELPIYDGETIIPPEKLKSILGIDNIEKVVRCKDCGYWKYVEDGCGECSHPRFHLDGHPDPTMEMNGFCSCGERREGE